MSHCGGRGSVAGGWRHAYTLRTHISVLESQTVPSGSHSWLHHVDVLKQTSAFSPPCKRFGHGGLVKTYWQGRSASSVAV